MSGPDEQIAKCARKKFWYQRRDAKRRAKEISKQTGDRYDFYACPHCGFFHLTNRSKQRGAS